MQSAFAVQPHQVPPSDGDHAADLSAVHQRSSVNVEPVASGSFDRRATANRSKSPMTPIHIRGSDSGGNIPQLGTVTGNILLGPEMATEPTSPPSKKGSKKKKKKGPKKDGDTDREEGDGPYVPGGQPAAVLSVNATAPPHGDEPNPFYYDDHMTKSPVQILKMVLIGCTLLPIRLLLFILMMIIGWILCKLMTIGISKERLREQPLRRAPLRWIFRKCARVMLWCLGFWWVSRKGVRNTRIPVAEAVERLKASFDLPPGSDPLDPASEAERIRLRDAACLALTVMYERTSDRRDGYHAPIMVLNHFSLVDTVFLAAYHDFMAVGKEQLLDLPLFGGICSALQYIPVLRESADSRKLVSKEINRRTRLELPQPSVIAPDVLNEFLSKRRQRRRDIRKAATDFGYARVPVDNVSKMKAAVAEREDIESCSDLDDDRVLRDAIPEPWQPLVIFPEATCTNGTALIQFKLGAFVPGVPVQPVTLQYPYRHFPQGWVGASSLGGQIIKSMLQVYNRLEVHYLPMYFPSMQERRDVPLFAENVRSVMAADLGVPRTDHTFEDVQLIDEANLLKVPFSNQLNIAMGLPQNASLGIRRAKEKLRQFAELDKDADGYLNRDEFGIFLGLQPPGTTTAALLARLELERDLPEGAQARAAMRANMALRDTIFERWMTYRNSDHRRKSAIVVTEAGGPSPAVRHGDAVDGADVESSASSEDTYPAPPPGGDPVVFRYKHRRAHRTAKEEVIDFASFLACAAAQRIRIKRRQLSRDAAAASSCDTASELQSMASFYLDEAKDEEMLYLITMCFGSFDLDHDGQISQDEFRRGMKLVCPSLLELGGGDTTGSVTGGPNATTGGPSSSLRDAWVDTTHPTSTVTVGRGAGSGGTGVVLPTQQQWDPVDALFHAADTDKDGMIQMEEFTTFVQKHPAILHHIVVTFSTHELTCF